VSPTLSKTQHGSQSGVRPPAAVEVAPEGVLAAARPTVGEPPVYAFVGLQPGALVPGIDESNVRAPVAVAEGIRAALDGLSSKTRSVTLILPDTAVRVFVLDFDSLPAKAAEVIPVLRFRLRKMVHFDVEKAGVSYQILSENKAECRVLIAVLPGEILEEYEAAVRAAGYEPGAVLPSSLASLAAVESEDPVLAACMTGWSLTTAITHGQDLLLYRTLELPEEPAQRLGEVQRDIAVAAAYFEDKLERRPRFLHYAGVSTAEDFGRWIKDPELTVIELTPRPETGATTSLKRLSIAGITGALAGAAR
jgi:type IV pilus assembly protein PilM